MTSPDSLTPAELPASTPLTAQPLTRPDQRRANAIGPAIDRWWLAELPDLPVRLPPRGSSAPARTVAELNTLLRQVEAPERLRMATLAWLGSAERAARTTQASYVRALSWWLWWVQARGLPVADISHSEALLYATATHAAGLSAASRRLRIGVVACWYSFLHASGIATCDPFAGIERPPRRRPADAPPTSIICRQNTFRTCSPGPPLTKANARKHGSAY